MKKALASAEKGRVAAEKEKETESKKVTEANAQVASVTKERNELLNELKNAKKAQDRVKVLVAENSKLTQKLAAAEKYLAAHGDKTGDETDKAAAVFREGKVREREQQLAKRFRSKFTNPANCG